MGPTPQWVWNLFIGIGALTGLILFASAISYESSSKKEIEQITRTFDDYCDQLKEEVKKKVETLIIEREVREKTTP